jgi:hypothetical protein
MGLGDGARFEGKPSADRCQFVFEAPYLPFDPRPTRCRALAASLQFAVVLNGSSSLA